jgi:preprotein translocase subunit SecG
MAINTQQIGKGLAYALFIGAIIFAVWFQSHSYADLVNWFTSSNAHIYKVESWTDNFFTPSTFTLAIWFCRLAIVLSAVGIWLVNRYTVANNSTLQRVHRSPTNLYDIIFIGAIGGLIWVYYSMRVGEATDEIFSAYFFAEQPLWLIGSYYPLPNNHILFNVINHVAFDFFGNAVLSGRIISGVCFIITLILISRFLELWIHDRWVRFALVILIGLQLPVFGYATQARGYSAYILRAWVAFSHLIRYVAHREDKDLLWYGLSCCLGMWLIPSWLYIWFGLGLSYVCCMIIRKRSDPQFWNITILSVIATYLMYLPVLCFSGWQSILANKYVTSKAHSSLFSFVEATFRERYFTGLFGDWMSLASMPWLGFVAIVMSSVLIAIKKEYRKLFLFYLCIMIGMVFMCLVMKKMPFYRNLAFHGLLVWLILGLSVATFLEKKVVVGIFILGIAVSIFQNQSKFPFQLYYYDISEIDRLQKNVPIRSESKIVIHEEAFYWLPRARQLSKHITVSNTPSLSAYFFIAKNDLVVDTTLWKKYGDGWYSTVYRRK